MSVQLKNLRADVDRLNTDFQATMRAFNIHPVEAERIEREFNELLGAWLVLLKKLEREIAEGDN